MLQLVIIRGLPGSGKSTFADMLCEASWPLRTFVKFEADDFFTNSAGEYNFDPAKLKDAHDRCFANVKDALYMGQSVVVSNTFSRHWEYAPYVELAKRMGIDCHVLTMQGKFANVHGVPDHVIERMRERWES